MLYSKLLMISYFLFIRFIKILCLKKCSKIVSYTLASYLRIPAVEMVQIGLSLTEILNQMRRKFSIKSSQISMIYYDSSIKGRLFISRSNIVEKIKFNMKMTVFWGLYDWSIFERKNADFLSVFSVHCNFVGNLTHNVANWGVGEFLTQVVYLKQVVVKG